MKLLAYTDGASRGNPGGSGIGVLVTKTDGTLVRSLKGFLGSTTNNVAEYTALIACLQTAAALRCTELIVHSDSELMVRQMTGQYKVKDAELKLLHRRALGLIAHARMKFSILHIERAQNAGADRLANEAIDQQIPLAGFSVLGAAQENLFH